MTKLGCRWDSVQKFISTRSDMKDEIYNDIPLMVDSDSYNRLVEAGIDEGMASHIGHVFMRDPLIVFDDTLDTVLTLSIYLYSLTKYDEAIFR